MRESKAEVITFKATKILTLLSIRFASPDDIDLIRSLCFRVWPQTYATLIPEHQISYMLDLMYGEEALNKQMREGHRFLILNYNKDPSGFASYSEIEPQLWKLHKLYVLPSLQGKGGGKALIDYVTEDVKNDRARVLQLNVNRGNKAKFFYEKLGFSIIREEDIDIGGGYFMNDFIMERKVDTLTR